MIIMAICDNCSHIFECPYMNGSRAIPSDSYPGGNGLIEVINGSIVDCVEYIEV